ncbi:MAG TPA: prephenate dehydratase [archaeon]|nr:prephenate dehydratase [archaeon]
MDMEKARAQINKIDAEMVDLLNKRIGLALEIGAEKKKRGESVYDSAREEEIIALLKKENGGTFPNDALELLFREIFSASRQAQQPMKISYLGPETTFSHGAAIKHFGSSADYEAHDSIKEVFNSVEKGEADFGVVPVENSLGGSVTYTYDMFINSPLNIVAEISEPISHNLISKYKLLEIEKVYVHPMALAQCREWLLKNLPKAEIIEVSSTAKSVESAKLYINSAGIGSELSAAHFGLNILARNIQDRANNVTRFLVIGKGTAKKSQKSKTSILFTVKNEPGTLFTALEALKRNGVNMNKIESRPNASKNWEYVFFVDMDGFIEDKGVNSAIEEMKKSTGFLKILGSYPDKSAQAK